MCSGPGRDRAHQHGRPGRPGRLDPRLRAPATALAGLDGLTGYAARSRSGWWPARSATSSPRCSAPRARWPRCAAPPGRARARRSTSRCSGQRDAARAAAGRPAARRGAPVPRGNEHAVYAPQMFLPGRRRVDLDRRPRPGRVTLRCALVGAPAERRPDRRAAARPRADTTAWIGVDQPAQRGGRLPRAPGRGRRGRARAGRRGSPRRPPRRRARGRRRAQAPPDGLPARVRFAAAREPPMSSVNTRARPRRAYGGGPH